MLVERKAGVIRGQAEIRTATARRINHESGMVVPARIAAMGNSPAEDVYIVSGEVRMQPDGSAIDRGNSDSFIVVCDAEGNYHATSPERLESVGKAVTPEQWAQTLENNGNTGGDGNDRSDGKNENNGSDGSNGEDPKPRGLFEYFPRWGRWSWRGDGADEGCGEPGQYGQSTGQGKRNEGHRRQLE